MDMIEKVAKAIEDNVAAGLPDGVQVDWGYAARAAIEALREPCDEQNDMLAAMWDAMFDSPFDGTTLPMLGAGFDAALDAALKQQ